MEIAQLEAAVERTKQTLEHRTERWIAHNEKRDGYIMRIKKALAHRLAVLKRTHEEDMAAQEARQYRMQREMSKQVVWLESKLNEVETHARYVTNDSFFIFMVWCDNYYLYLRKNIQTANDKCNEAELQRDSIFATQAATVKTAVKQARLDERAILGKAIARHKGKIAELTSKIAALSNGSVDAMYKARTSRLQANQSTQQTQGLLSAATSFQHEVQQLHQQLSKQTETLIDLAEQLEAKDRLATAEDAVPIKEFGKVRDGNRGQATWPLYVWELIIEQLVNGTPP